MIGAIIGDIVGSRFEFDNTSSKDFTLFTNECEFTDDTICTIAIADAILHGKDYRDTLLSWCERYPNPKGEYGAGFYNWIMQGGLLPYYSFGNGSAMRVSPVAWAWDNQPKIVREAIKTAEVSHNHPDGLIGAMVTALLIFYNKRLPNREMSREVCKDIVTQYYGVYELNLPRRGVFDVTCQGCVPLAWYIVENSEDFEDAIRNAVAYGGDSDTLAAIVGSIAEARFGVPPMLRDEALSYLPDEMLKVYHYFTKKYGK